jgi:hypothetical protein
MLLGFWSLFLNPHHIQRAAVILRPSTLLKFHDMLKKRKYRLLYNAHRKGKPGPEGPSRELIEAIVDKSVVTLRMRNGTSKSPFRPRLSRQPIMPRPPCVRAASPHHRRLGAGYAALPQMA